MADSANGSKVEEAAIGRFRTAVESSNESNAGYIWLMSSREHDDLIGLQFSTDPGVRNVRPEHFERLLDLDENISLRYVALVDDVPEAVLSLGEFLKEHRISDHVFLAHPALAATALETCGVRVRARRSFFAVPDENPLGRPDSIRSNLSRSGRRGRTSHELGTLMDEVERSLLAAETLLAAKTDPDSESLPPPVNDIYPAASSETDPSLTVDTPDTSPDQALLQVAPSDSEQSQAEPLLVEADVPADATVSEPFIAPHRNPLRQTLSGREIMAMEHAIVAREARQRLAYLRSLLVRRLISFTVLGFLLGVLGVLALNLPSDTHVLRAWCLGGAMTGLLLGLFSYWQRHGRDLQRWRRTYSVVRGSRSGAVDKALNGTRESLRAA